MSRLQTIILLLTAASLPLAGCEDDVDLGARDGGPTTSDGPGSGDGPGSVGKDKGARCSAADKPDCVHGCGSDWFEEAECKAGTWHCPADTVVASTCSSGWSCPAAQPTPGTSCDAPAGKTCDYFMEASRCNYLDLYLHCTCDATGWSCKNDFEDCPCPSAESAPKTGDLCAVPGPSSCAYDDKKCTCDGSTWTCTVSCPPAPSCNWCGGFPIQDAGGCTVDYRCANGKNACGTDPCDATPSVCQPGEICGADMLCWPEVSFACGAKTSCDVGKTYCERVTPGACGGPPVPDGGVCEPDCQPTSCGTGTGEVCLCEDYSCKALPAGCNDCACIQGALGGSCTCSGDADTGLEVHCAAP